MRRWVHPRLYSVSRYRTRLLSTVSGDPEAPTTPAQIKNDDTIAKPSIVARSLREASLSPEHVTFLDLSSSNTFVCRNMFCEKVGESCICRLSLWLSQMGPRLPSLTSLSLASNGLETIPESIEELKHIKLLDLKDNDIQTLPDSLWKLGSLEVLDLRNNPKISRRCLESKTKIDGYWLKDVNILL